MSVIGFADDTNIIAFGQTAQENCRTLERAWAVCEKWSESRGMEFAPEKKQTYPLLKNTKPTSRSGAAGEYYKRAYNVYPVPGSMVGQETHMESTSKGSPTETRDTTARAHQAGGCVLGFLPSQGPRSVRESNPLRNGVW